MPAIPALGPLALIDRVEIDSLQRKRSRVFGVRCSVFSVQCSIFSDQCPVISVCRRPGSRDVSSRRLTVRVDGSRSIARLMSLPDQCLAARGSHRFRHGWLRPGRNAPVPPGPRPTSRCSVRPRQNLTEQWAGDGALGQQQCARGRNLEVFGDRVTIDRTVRERGAAAIDQAAVALADPAIGIVVVMVP